MTGKPQFQLSRWAMLLGSVVAATTLVACNSGGSSSAGSAPVINGTAAIGAPLVNANISVKCADNSTYTTTSGVNGAFNVGAVGDSSLPCALQASGGDPDPGTPLHSLATVSGITNITPLTDLIMAYATGATPDTWFEGISNTSLPALGASLADATQKVLDQLRANGFDIAADFDPLNTEFSPTAGDAYDDLLEAIMTSVGSVANYNDLLAALADGDLDALPSYSDNNNVPGCQEDCREFLNSLVDNFGGSSDHWVQNGDEVTFYVASTEGRPPAEGDEVAESTLEPGELNEKFPLSGTNLDYYLTINKTTGIITADNNDGYTVSFNAFDEAVAYQEAKHDNELNKANYAYISFNPLLKDNAANLNALLIRGYKDITGADTTKPDITFQMSTDWKTCKEEFGDEVDRCNSVYLDSNPVESEDDELQPR